MHLYHIPLVHVGRISHPSSFCPFLVKTFPGGHIGVQYAGHCFPFLFLPKSSFSIHLLNPGHPFDNGSTEQDIWDSSQI